RKLFDGSLRWSTEESAVPRLFSARWFENHPALDLEERVRNLRRFNIVVDLGFSKAKIKEDIEAWVNGIDDHGIMKYALRRGKGATPAWHKLRELAAYRLNNIGKMNHKGVLEFIKGQTKNNPQDFNHVLPNYNPSGFSEAVKN